MRITRIERNEEWLAQREAELKQIKLEVKEGRYNTHDPEKIGVVASRVLAELMAEMVDRPEPVVFHEGRIMPSKAERCISTISGTNYSIGMFQNGQIIAWICRDNVWAELYRVQNGCHDDLEILARVARIVVEMTPERRTQQILQHGTPCGTCGKGALYRMGRWTMWVVTPENQGYFYKLL